MEQVQYIISQFLFRSFLFTIYSSIELAKPHLLLFKAEVQHHPYTNIQIILTNIALAVLKSWTIKEEGTRFICVRYKRKA